MSELAARVQEIEDVRAIERLNTEYARLIDAGRLEEFSELFRNGVWRGHVGYDAVLSWLRGNVRLYDGTPRTHHLVSGLEVAVDGDRAESWSTITVHLQPAVGEAITPITVSDYHDTYERGEAGWSFRTRAVRRRLEGDMRAHLRDQTA